VFLTNGVPVVCVSRTRGPRCSGLAKSVNARMVCGILSVVDPGEMNRGKGQS
jgi:hypothetical protein